LPLLYFFEHWNPLYGIAQDVVCIVAILALRRGPAPADALNRRARRFSTSLIVGLVAEACFAGMFLQTRAHEMAVYFASPGASWGYINFVPALVLVFVWPDLLWTLAGLYFPGFVRDPPRLFRWARVAGACLVVLLATAALGFWTHVMGVEAEGARFQRVGYEIVGSGVQFKGAFGEGDAAGMG